jgi:hypothetical protein
LVYGANLVTRGVLEKTVDLPKEQISLLYLRPDDENRVFEMVGGQWERVALSSNAASMLAKTRYAAQFFRRVSQSRPAVSQGAN